MKGEGIGVLRRKVGEAGCFFGEILKQNRHFESLS